MEWYYAHGGQRSGPVSHVAFVELVRTGVVRADSLVWRQGMPNWRAYGELVAEQGAGGELPAPAVIVAGAAAAEVTATPAGEPVAELDTEVCAVTGRRYPRSQMFQHDGHWVSVANRDAYFRGTGAGGEAATAAGQPDMVYAGFWLRVAARLIDGVITGILASVYLVPLFIGLVRELGMDFNPAELSAEQVALIEAVQFKASLVLLVLSFFYTWFFLVRFGGTPGKLLLGLRVVRSDGEKIGHGRAIGRFAADILNKFTFSLAYVIVAIDDQKRGIHDLLARTRVIKKR